MQLKHLRLITVAFFTLAISPPLYAEYLKYPITGVVTTPYSSSHTAVDISSGSGSLPYGNVDYDGNGYYERSGSNLYAGGSGTVSSVYNSWTYNGCGKNVRIGHSNGYTSGYCHMFSISVSSGQYVSQGQKIGVEGNTGYVAGSTGLHVHFYLEKNGARQSVPGYTGQSITVGQSTGIDIGGGGSCTVPSAPSWTTPTPYQTISSSSVYLDWPSVSGATSYRVLVYYWANNTWNYYYEWTGVTSSNFTMWPVVHYSYYAFQVKAVNSCGQSGGSPWGGFYWNK